MYYPMMAQRVKHGKVSTSSNAVEGGIIAAVDPSFLSLLSAYCAKATYGAKCGAQHGKSEPLKRLLKKIDHVKFVCGPP
jgi:hypothetical protein